MIGYVTLGVSDIARARDFYDAVLGLLGAKRLMQMDDYLDGYTQYGTSFEEACLAITHPFDGKPASVGNGGMVALYAPTRDKVAAVYEKALALGGSDEGGPGVRGGDDKPGAFYGAYFRDPDGNKLCAFTMSG